MPDATDNCPTPANADQAADDGDKLGNACESSNPEVAESGAEVTGGAPRCRGARPK